MNLRICGTLAVIVVYALGLASMAMVFFGMLRLAITVFPRMTGSL